MKAEQGWLRALLRGIASVFDLFPRVENPYRDRSDRDALMSDWEAVGGDLREAIRQTAATSTAVQSDDPRSPGA